MTEQIDDKNLRQAIRDIMNCPDLPVSDGDRKNLLKFAFSTKEPELLNSLLVPHLDHFLKYSNLSEENTVKMSLTVARNLLQKISE